MSATEGGRALPEQSRRPQGTWGSSMGYFASAMLCDLEQEEQGWCSWLSIVTLPNLAFTCMQMPGPSGAVTLPSEHQGHPSFHSHALQPHTCPRLY